jgi:FKBP-type peptidyl-prolyl cis-trans isomerase
MISARRHARAVLVSLPLALACGGSVRAIPQPQPIEKQVFAPALNVNLAASTRTQDGVYYRDLVAGSGAELAAGQRVYVRYTLYLPDGTFIESNDTAAAPFDFPFRTGFVILGWDEGLIGAHVGTTRQLVIPSALGYGARGSQAIPPNSNLVFVVKVLDAK